MTAGAQHESEPAVPGDQDDNGDANQDAIQDANQDANQDEDEHEAQREAAAAALRGLLHAFVGHEIADRELADVTESAERLTAAFDAGAHRDRMTLMRAAQARTGETDLLATRRAGFEDRAVAGRANPASVPFTTWREGDTMLADITLGPAFEGAPGRAHGGIVAAVFDDFTGLVIGMLHQPAFTGELTVRFVRPVPVRTPLRFRTWLERRDGRKLYIEADAHDGDVLVATCKATYIAVDPSVFERAPDPR
jgi:acyl-coenzyme A thioesterase PaaI-like protein